MTGKIEILTKNSSTHIFGRNKLTSSAYEEWWLFNFFALVGHRENKLKKGPGLSQEKKFFAPIFGRNKQTSSAYEEWWLFDFFALVGHKENKLKKDQDSELPGYHIRWVLGFYD